MRCRTQIALKRKIAQSRAPVYWSLPARSVGNGREFVHVCAARRKAGAADLLQLVAFVVAISRWRRGRPSNLSTPTGWRQRRMARCGRRRRTEISSACSRSSERKGSSRSSRWVCRVCACRRGVLEMPATEPTVQLVLYFARVHSDQRYVLECTASHHPPSLPQVEAEKQVCMELHQLLMKERRLHCHLPNNASQLTLRAIDMVDVQDKVTRRDGIIYSQVCVSSS